MVHCYKHVIESMVCMHQLVGGSSDSSFKLNKRQCQILVEELVETKLFLEERSACSKFGEGVEYIILQHLCSVIKRAEVLVKKCCCKDVESWLVSAMMLVEIQEEFMAIILDIHLWRMLLDFAITCGRGISQEKKVEEMKIMDEEYHQLFKDLHRNSHALRQAAVEDKETIILRISKIVDLHGSTSGLDYVRATYLQSWLTSSATCRNMDLEQWEPIHLLGRGGCGAVMKVKWLGVECALKMLDVQDEKEATALKGLFHPNIIRLFHYWEDCPEDPQSRLLMELMPKDLGAYMRGVLKSVSSSKMHMGKDSVPFSLPVAIDIMYQIAQAMRYMHEKHLTHRDLKPANILVKERPRMDLTCLDGARYLDIKLADFGLVKSYNNTSTFQAHSKNTGTGMYRAPEIFGKDMTQKRHYSSMVDVWSFGITCAEILSGKQAYAECVDMSPADIQAMIREEGLRPTLPKHCPPYLAFCIKSCWEFLPSRRPTFASLCKLLRHAKLLSLGVTKLDDTKHFFAYTTRSDQVQSLNSSPSSSKARVVSTFFQSSLKFMGIGPRQVPSFVEGDLEVIQRSSASSSSSHGDRNNGSQEANGYQLRAPPLGSYQDDVVGPFPIHLLMAATALNSEVNHFAKVLIINMNKHPVELESLKQTILREVGDDMDSADHWKFLVQAFICRQFFDGFHASNGYFGVEYFDNDQMTKFISFADFSKFKDKASTISMLLDLDSPDYSFLGRFCFKKFKSIFGDLASNQPLPIYQEEWNAIERGCHPKTVFYQSFLKVAVSVWLVHRLVHSFEEKVEMLIYEKGANFQRQTMESVAPWSYGDEYEEADVNTEVSFSVIPGFQMSGIVVKCAVYLHSKSRRTFLEMNELRNDCLATVSSLPWNQSVMLGTPGPSTDLDDVRRTRPVFTESYCSRYRSRYRYVARDTKTSEWRRRLANIRPNPSV